MADEKNEPTATDGSATQADDGDAAETAAEAGTPTEAGSTDPADKAKTADEVVKGDKAKAPDKAGTAGDAPKKVVAKKKVVSKRVTPKGGAVSGSTAAHAHAPEGDDASGSKRYTPPTAKYDHAPSPTWVPVLMFALLGIGCLIIPLNYAGLFGEPQNWRLLVGLASILGGIIAATNYR